MNHPCLSILAWLALAFGASGLAHAQDASADDMAKHRALLADDNPAELWEMRGEALWKKPAGPNQVSLERCDLGKGPGIVKGTYVELPRYFKDSNRVMELEQRLAWCRVHLQGLTQEQALSQPFAAPEKPSDIEAMVAWITSESRGMKMAVSIRHPEEKRAYEIGKRLFAYRGGSHDFSCATCHSADAKRIRLQDLPNMLNKENAQAAYTSWPAYRISQGEVRTMQHRLNDCYRQQRFPEPAYASDAITALTLFLAKNAEGGVYAAPALKR